MKSFVSIFLILIAIGCDKQPKVNTVAKINWQAKALSAEELEKMDTLEAGVSYLSVYPQVFNVEESKTQALTATVSIRNTSRTDSIYISSAKYYNTKGELIRVYFDYTVCLLPLETDHIIIPHKDNTGGTGANFIFEWQKKSKTPDPLFEAVMLSTYGQQGISFTTHGLRIE